MECRAACEYSQARTGPPCSKGERVETDFSCLDWVFGCGWVCQRPRPWPGHAGRHGFAGRRFVDRASRARQGDPDARRREARRAADARPRRPSRRATSRTPKRCWPARGPAGRISAASSSGTRPSSCAAIFSGPGQRQHEPPGRRRMAACCVGNKESPPAVDPIRSGSRPRRGFAAAQPLRRALPAASSIGSRTAAPFNMGLLSASRRRPSPTPPAGRATNCWSAPAGLWPWAIPAAPGPGAAGQGACR